MIDGRTPYACCLRSARVSGSYPPAAQLFSGRPPAEGRSASDASAFRRHTCPAIPFVNVALIVANFAVWIFYELPHLGSAMFHASFYPCTVNGTCHGPEPWGVSWFTAMFMHGSWDHILGNMLFLAIFGKNVEDSLGHVRYLALYIIGGFVAAMTQALMTLIGGTAAEALCRCSALAARSQRCSVPTSSFIRTPGS